MNLKKQKGAVLVFGLILLLVMTLIGVSATTVSVFDEHLGSSLRDKDASFQAAEAALNTGENFISVNKNNAAALAQIKDSTKQIQVGKVACTDNAGAVFDNVNSTQLSAADYDATNGGAEAALVSSPRYIVEKIGSMPLGGLTARQYGKQYNTDTYRVTAQGAGRGTNTLGSARSLTYLQSYYSINH